MLFYFIFAIFVCVTLFLFLENIVHIENNSKLISLETNPPELPRIINGEPVNFICCSLPSTFMSSNNIFRPFTSKSEIMQNEYH